MKTRNRAVLLYEYNGQIIQYSMYMNDADSSYGQTEIDHLTDEYKIKTQEKFVVNVQEYDIANYENE